MAKVHPDMEPVAERIGKIKRLRKMTHAELAEKLKEATDEEWSVGRVTNLLTARTRIDVITLAYIAEIQDMPLNYYVHGEVPEGKAHEVLTQSAKGGTYNVEYANSTDRILELDVA